VKVRSLCLSYSEEFVMSNVMENTKRFGYLEVRSERDADEHVVALTGELDLDGAERVTQELLRAETSDARRIVLDLSGLEFMDSTGIRLIIAAHARSRMDGDRLVLVRGPQAVHRVFELTGIAERLPFDEPDPSAGASAKGRAGAAARAQGGSATAGSVRIQTTRP